MENAITCAKVESQRSSVPTVESGFGISSYEVKQSVTRQSIPFPAKRSHEVHGFAARKSGTDVLTSKNKRLLHLPKTVMNLAATT